MSYSYNDKVPDGYKQGQVQNFTPQQMQLHDQQYSQVNPGSYLSRLASGDEATFNQMEAPAHRQFESKLGQIGSRFSGAGMGARKSSGFNLTTSQAASDFAQDLQSKRQELQRQAINDLMGYSNQILNQKPYDRFLVEEQQEPQDNSFWSALGGAIPGALASFATGGFGGNDFMQNSYRPRGGGDMSNGSYSRQSFMGG